MSKLQFSLIQTALFWEDKKNNLKQFEEKIGRLPSSAQVVVLPEMFTTGFSMQPESLAENMQGDSVKWMKRIAAEKKIIITGSLIIEENGNYYNRMIWMQPDGRFGYYDKRHLFAFGEEDQQSSNCKSDIILVCDPSILCAYPQAGDVRWHPTFFIHPAAYFYFFRFYF